MLWKTPVMIPKWSMLAAVALALASAAPARHAGQGVGSAGDEDPKPVEKISRREPIFDEQADATRQIALALARARRENRRVLVEWGANWCSWCRMLRDLSASDRKIKRTLVYEYEVVGIDVGRFDRNLDLAAQYGVDLEQGLGIPFLTILDAEGNILAVLATSSLELKKIGRKGYDPTKVLAQLDLYQAPYLSADSLLAGAVTAAKAKEKLVFLHFGAPGSPECRRLESWVDSADAAVLLAKDFELLKIDVERTIGGRELMRGMRKDGRKTLPWFAILDARGSPLATSEGEYCDNIQFPSKPAEIAEFAAMLRKTAKRLTPAEIETLGQSLLELSAKPEQREKQPEQGEKQPEQGEKQEEPREGKQKEEPSAGHGDDRPREHPQEKNEDDGQEAGG